MERKLLEIGSLHGYEIKELINLKNNTASKYSRIVLAVITMRYRGCSNKVTI